MAEAKDKNVWTVLPKLVAMGDRERARKLRRSLWLWLIVVVVVVTAVGTVVNLMTVDRDPQDPVENWLQSMVDGRSRQGLATFSTGGSGYMGSSALPNRAYRAAEGRIDRFEITGVQAAGTTAEITARVWWADGEIPEGGVQGEEHTWTAVKERRTGPFNDHWVLSKHQPDVLSVRAPAVSSIAINGVNQRLKPRDRAVADGNGGVWSWEAMPGRFTVDLPEGSHYVLAQPVEPVVVGLEDPAVHEVAIELEPSPALWEEVDDAIRDEVDDCMSKTSVAPEGCPSSQRWAEGEVPMAEVPSGAMVTPSAATATPTPAGSPTRGASIEDVEWELVSRPSLWLIPDDDTASRLDWKASEHNTAQARLTYLEDGRRIEELIDFPVHVDVTSDGNSADIEVRLD
ncbi:hypothetical protein FCK90_04515 [Kocuria coralli]|uniref:Uncharacterized protein n=1 Tax=Kocuria coralli TaxID=1461025 RepID=A0A5J5KYT2_9MICC|nr:hypothetical protein FCK90_04515 [Kocuria coralli]